MQAPRIGRWRSPASSASTRVGDPPCSALDPARDNADSRCRPGHHGVRREQADALRREVDNRIEDRAPAEPERPTAPTPAPAVTAGTRTRADFDAAVLAEVGRQAPASSTVLHTAIGAKLDEVRASLKRLVDTGRVTRSGKRRFTRYTLK